MSAKKGLGRLYHQLTPEERFRLDVLALARGDEEESERLTRTCPLRGYTMNDRKFVGRWEAARELAMLAYVDVARPMDKIKMIDAFRSIIPYLSTIWEDDVHSAYFDGHMAGSRYAWKWSGKAGEPPGWKANEEEAERNADPTIDEDLQKWTGKERYTRLEGKREHIRELIEQRGCELLYLPPYSPEFNPPYIGGFCEDQSSCAQGRSRTQEALVEAISRSSSWSQVRTPVLSSTTVGTPLRFNNYDERCGVQLWSPSRSEERSGKSISCWQK